MEIHIRGLRQFSLLPIISRSHSKSSHSDKWIHAAKAQLIED